MIFLWASILCISYIIHVYWMVYVSNVQHDCSLPYLHVLLWPCPYYTCKKVTSIIMTINHDCKDHVWESCSAIMFYGLYVSPYHADMTYMKLAWIIDARPIYTNQTQTLNF